MYEYMQYPSSTCLLHGLFYCHRRSPILLQPGAMERAVSGATARRWLVALSPGARDPGPVDEPWAGENKHIHIIYIYIIYIYTLYIYTLYI